MRDVKLNSSYTGLDKPHLLHLLLKAFMRSSTIWNCLKESKGVPELALLM